MRFFSRFESLLELASCLEADAGDASRSDGSRPSRLLERKERTLDARSGRASLEGLGGGGMLMSEVVGRPVGRANIEVRPLVARGVGIPPRLWRFLARLGVVGTTLDAARMPAIEDRGVLAVKEEAVGAVLRAGLVCPRLVLLGGREESESSWRLDEGAAKLFRAVSRLAGREVERAEAGLLAGVAEGSRTLRREAVREGVAEGGRELLILAYRREGLIAPDRSTRSEAREDGRLDKEEAGRATASVGGA